ncbi:MAG: RidA family protein [Alphaproteobacteria bacterium]|nr:RidA family protein [Alphaproteobacteria bacterium]
MNRVLEPKGWAKPIGYANGIEAKGRLIFLAGQIGWNAQQKFEVHDVGSQFRVALQNICAVLAEAGGKPEHIVRITAFCIDKPGYLAKRREIGAAWKDVIGRHYPCMSMIFVKDLVDEGALIELEATAVIPD